MLADLGTRCYVTACFMGPTRSTVYRRIWRVGTRVLLLLFLDIQAHFDLQLQPVLLSFICDPACLGDLSRLERGANSIDNIAFLATFA